METAEATAAATMAGSTASAEVAPQKSSPARFSMRGLLLIVTAAAVLLGAWRLLGLGWSFVVFFGLVSLMPFSIPRFRWKRYYGVAWSAVYGPFVGTALYTLAYVPCDHCKAATWTTLPFGPGLVPFQLVRSLVNFGRPGDLVSFGLAMVFSMLLVPALTWLVYRRGWVARSIVLTIIVALNTFSAIALLAMIRA